MIHYFTLNVDFFAIFLETQGKLDNLVTRDGRVTLSRQGTSHFYMRPEVLEMVLYFARGVARIIIRTSLAEDYGS